MPLPVLQPQELEEPELDVASHGCSDAEAALGVCRKLRAKMAFLPLRNADGAPLYWQKGDGSTTVYWCLRTMECAGPDGGLSHATLCSAERLCFEPL